MSLTNYAKTELQAAGYFDEDSDYGGLVGEAVMELIEVFDKQGHSGMSAPYVASIFNKLANFEPLLPITGKDEEWEQVTYVELYNKYTWQDYETYNEKSQRTWKHEFNDSGRYLVTTTYLNKCTGIDTFTIHKLDVCKPFKATSVKTIVKNTDLRIIGYYDMIGKQVDYMRSNEVYIVLYSNGQRRKVMQVQN